MKRKIFSIILAVVLLYGLALPALAAEGDEQTPFTQTILIDSVEDFLSFAENCSLDTWSLDKKVVLQTDLSLSGTDFEGIATFGGDFQGNGHTVSGLTIEESVAPAGLFRYLQATAVVRDLTVRGEIAPGGDASGVGGIAGENYGTIDGCVFAGQLQGKTDVGGIAGRNYGSVLDCKADGKLTGENRTGGIAGCNEGAIDGCENSAQINVDSVDPAIDPTAIDLDFNMDLSKLADADTSDAAKDTGGIAGYSTGAIVGCTNAGTVGYPHISYNLGGIVGRNCGFVGSCGNTGLIQGRKDIGGIAGQIEPNVATILSPDYLETLSKQFENLGGLTSAAGSHAASAGGEVQACIERIAAYESSARAALDAIASDLGESLDGDPETRPDISGIQALGSAIQGMINATKSLRDAVSGGVEDLSDDVSAISGQINGISRTFALATEDAKKETVTDISDVDLEDISEGKVLGCTNSAAVEGDVNVGGIVGIMGLEYDIDPEDDAPSGSVTQRRRYELKAIVQDCANTGTVNSKRSYVGSICGRMELGLISGCRGCGAVASESGDYAGGIAGLGGGTVQQCFAKCTLSGKSYVGGIVGCGIAEDHSGESSTVRDCYSMVEITEAEQYFGGISGANTGTFTGNYFVSDSLAGINGVSYSALAEPISYDALWRVQALPNELRQFTLSFIADGKIIRELPFDYGDSFDFSVYPEIPEKDGYYAQWSTDDLTELRFDKRVEVEYYPYITSLDSSDLRPDGKNMLFVQGQFKSGDALQVVPGTTDFPETEDLRLLERWRVSIPADGLESHSVRYLPAEEGVAVYLWNNGIWSKLSPETMGSYLEFEVPGAEAEFAVVTEPAKELPPYILWAALAAFLVGILLAAAVRKKKKAEAAPQAETGKSKKRKRLLGLATLCLICAAMAACLYFWLPQTKAGQSIRAYDILNTWLEQPEQEMRLTVKAQVDEKDANFTAQIARTHIGGTSVSVISENGRKLYFTEDAVFLENGDAYRLNSAAPDYANLLELVLAAYEHVEFDSTDGIYTVTAENEEATAMLKLLLPSEEALLPETNRLTVHLITEEGTLTQIRFTGAGNLTDSVKTPFSLAASIDVLPASGAVTVPKKVEQCIVSGNYHPREIYSDEFLKLLEAWSHIRGRNPIAAKITLEADCGPLVVSDTFDYYQWKESGRIVQSIEKGGEAVFFTDSGVCDSQGNQAPAVSANVDAGELLDIAYQNFSRVDFQFRQEDTASFYLVSLEPSGMETIANALVPQTKDMDITFEKGSIRLVIEDGQLQTITVSCGGSSQVLAATLDCRLKADVRFTDDTPEKELPEKVKEALLST